MLTGLANSGETRGAFSLIEGVLKPGHEPPPRVHTREDELFSVLEGSFDVYVGNEMFSEEKEGSVFLPRDEPHAFIIRSLRIRLLTLFRPGGLEETLFRKSVPAKRLDMPVEAINYSTADLQEVTERLGQYGVRIFTPEEILSEMPSYARARKAVA